MVTRFDMENQAIQERIASALEEIVNHLDILGNQAAMALELADEEGKLIDSLEPFTEEEIEALKKSEDLRRETR